MDDCNSHSHSRLVSQEQQAEQPWHQGRLHKPHRAVRAAYEE